MCRTLQVFIVLVTGAVVSLTAAAPQAPAQQPPTFRVEVNYVEIDARATDAQGKFINDLTAKDFQVFEDGAPQTIKVFARVNLPIERQDPPLFRNAPIEPDVRSNRDEFNGRVFILVLDDLQTDARRSIRVRRAARQFIERYIGANDLAAVVYTSGAADRGQEFTDSRSRLLAAVDKFLGNKLPSEFMSKLDDYYRSQVMRDPVRDTNLAERGHKARNSLLTLRNLAQYLSSVRGRHKAVVWFGEGIDYDLDNPFTPDFSVLRDTMKAAIDEATRAGVSFYGVDARGLGAGLDETIDIGGVPADDPYFTSPSTAIQNEVRRAQDNLRVMSEQTGGFAIINQNDFNTGFQKIVEDNSNYYVLGYYPSNDKRDGRFRKVDVRVSRPGAKVQARNGYTAPKGKPAATAANMNAVCDRPDWTLLIRDPRPDRSPHIACDLAVDLADRVRGASRPQRQRRHEPGNHRRLRRVFAEERLVSPELVIAVANRTPIHRRWLRREELCIGGRGLSRRVLLDGFEMIENPQRATVCREDHVHCSSGPG